MIHLFFINRIIAIRMFELGKTDHLWDIAKRYPVLSNHPYTLEPLGYDHAINLIESFKPKRVLEVGHGTMTFIFDIFFR